MARKKIAAGNWKMYTDTNLAGKLVSEVVNICKDEYNGSAEVIFAPPFPFLSLVQHFIKGNPRFKLAAQNIHDAAQGAFTGEVSAAMLVSVGASYVILGHSERRAYFGEDNAWLAKKTDRALAAGLSPIFCVGETLEEREANRTFDVIGTQLREGIFHLTAAQMANVVIAYEPVWAIGTGKTATPEQAQEVHAFIRQQLAATFGDTTAENTSILYGGSVKPNNAQELFSQPDIDGGLVGGASLDSRDFSEIIKALA